MAFDDKKLYLGNLSLDQSDTEIVSMCEEFGRVVAFNRPPSNKSIAFPTYENASDAKNAMESMAQKGMRVNFAKLTIGTASGNGFPSKGFESSKERHDEFGLNKKLNDFAEKINSTNDIPKDVLDDEKCSENGEYHECVRCMEKAFDKCERCGDFYCSTECQTEDWPRHRPLCFPIPRLVRAKETNLSDSRCSISKPSDFLFANNLAKRNSSQNLVVSVDAADGTTKVTAPIVQPLNTMSNAPRIAATKVSSLNSTPERIVTMSTPPRVLASPKIEPTLPQVAASKVVSPQIPLRVPESPKGEHTLSKLAAKMTACSQVAMKPSEPSKQSASQPDKKVESASATVIQNNEKVIVTHVCNNYQVYVRSAALDSEYNKLLLDASKSAEKAESLKEMPARGDAVLALFESLFYRARVINADSEKAIKVAYYDYGNMDHVQLKDLKVLRDDLKEHPRYTVKVTLKDVNQQKGNTNAVAYLSDFIDGTELLIESGQNEIKLNSMVELIHPDTKEVINNKVNELIAAKESTTNGSFTDTKAITVNENKIFTIKDVELKRCEGQKKKLRILNNSLLTRRMNVITCIDSADINLFLENDEIIQTYGKRVLNAPAYTPQQDAELCVFLELENDDITWYRGVLERIKPEKNKALMTQIDYGKSVWVDFKNIRMFAKECILPVFSFSCSVDGYDEDLSEMEKKELMEKFIEYEEVTVLSIELPNAADLHKIKIK